MSVLAIVALGLGGWCLASLLVAVAVGRAFRAGEMSENDLEFARIVRGYDAAGV